MTRVLHVIVGPDEHGVVRHATEVARACGDDVRRFRHASSAEIAAGYDVVHVPYTDGLFASDCEASADTFERLAQAVRARGSRLSVALHDIPGGNSTLAVRRRSAYRRVSMQATGVVISSHQEYAAGRSLWDAVAVARVISLPVDPRPLAQPAPSGRSVAVLGFVYPDRGYECVVDELPSGSGLLALGRAADGHHALPDQIAGYAKRAARDWHLTGFLADDELASRLLTVAVPVAPNRRVGASASIATWLAHGRRPLVAASAYAAELQSLWPQTIDVYDPGRPGALRKAISRAIAEPSTTVLAEGIVTGPSLAEVAASYADYFRAISSAAAVAFHDRPAVSGNRWDLLNGQWPAVVPSVSVVIPYYESQHQLNLVLAALSIQTHPLDRLQVVVADDGSSVAPDLSAARGLDCRYVRQPDLGFRAAAVRNLGAAAAEGQILAFLDGDTVPEPDYLRQLSRLPALLGSALVVGRRRHADLRDWTPDALKSWLAEGGPGPRVLAEPAWLADGYRASRNLLDVDARSYRYVISAVLAMSREFFAEIGGFCEEFTSYGGEDWELAYRAYNAAAVMAHVPQAIAWHDGPEWAERPGDKAIVKAAEERRLRRLVPDPVARGPGQWMPYPAVAVKLTDGDPAAIRSTAETAFRSGTDCGFWITGPLAAATTVALADPRIQVGPPPPDVLARARVVVDLDHPADLSGLAMWTREAEADGEVLLPMGRLRSTRAVHHLLRAGVLPRVTSQPTQP